MGASRHVRRGRIGGHGHDTVTKARLAATRTQNTIYAKIDGVWLAPAWLEGREVIAVFEDRAEPKPSYIMWLEWRDGRITFIRDYRYVRYIVADAELALAPSAKPAGDGDKHWR